MMMLGLLGLVLLALLLIRNRGQNAAAEQKAGIGVEKRDQSKKILHLEC